LRVSKDDRIVEKILSGCSVLLHWIGHSQEPIANRDSASLGEDAEQLACVQGVQGKRAEHVSIGIVRGPQKPCKFTRHELLKAVVDYQLAKLPEDGVEIRRIMQKFVVERPQRAGAHNRVLRDQAFVYIVRSHRRAGIDPEEAISTLWSD
jgi:hypothetical protein